MVSQFVSPHNFGLLGDLDFDFPEGTHAIGRLDNHSEGLLILTTNKKVTKLLFQGETMHARTYLVQVKKDVSEQSLQQLKTGVTIRIKGDVDYITKPCTVEIIKDPTNHFNILQDVVIYGQHTWLMITLTEGKFHQVRKMVGVLGHRCTRLIRLSIENIALGNLKPGAVKEMAEEEFFNKLKINNWK